MTLVTDQIGMVIDRDENDNQSGGDPRTLRYAFGGVTMGEVSNNGTSNMNYVAAIADRLHANWSNTGAFRGGSTYGTSSADFDQSFDSINANTQAGSGSAYTANGGDTLRSIAASIWGDASLWYLLAEANGLSLATPLVAGQSIMIPNKQVNSHNNSSTFRPYDPNEAIGDNSPNAINPNNSTTAGKKGKKCGIVGQILIVVVAVAVTALTAGAGAMLAGAAPGILSGMGAIAAGTTGLSIGALAGIGAVAGAVGSIASQAVGIATGVQSKFNWKGVAMGAISGAISAGVGAAGPFANVGSKFAQGALNAGLSSALSQGVGVATGLQKKFDFAGVAGAALAGGISARLGGRTQSLEDNSSIGNIFAHTGISAASGLANAAARSIITGTSFGDNIMAALPDIIGGTIGNLISAKLAKSAPQGNTDYDGDGVVSGFEESDSYANAVAAAEAFGDQGEGTPEAWETGDFDPADGWSGPFFTTDLGSDGGLFDPFGLSVDGQLAPVPAVLTTGFGEDGLLNGLVSDGVFRTFDGLSIDQSGSPIDMAFIEALSGRPRGFVTRFNIDIRVEDIRGGHVQSLHVGKDDNFLRRRLSTPLPGSNSGASYYLTETSTFTTVDSANRLINATLSMRAFEVDAWLRGNASFSPGFTANFRTPTGRTMYSRAAVVSNNRRPGGFSTETVFAVTVFLRRAPYLPNGFYVRTAFPSPWPPMSGMGQ